MGERGIGACEAVVSEPAIRVLLLERGLDAADRRRAVFRLVDEITEAINCPGAEACVRLDLAGADEGAVGPVVPVLVQISNQKFAARRAADNMSSLFSRSYAEHQPSSTIPVLKAAGVCRSGGHMGPPCTAPEGI